jgi:hypothetical protein
MNVSYAQSVTIGPEFFTKSFHDYRDKFWAFAREIMQNSLDCGSTAIDITVVEVPDDDCTLVVVRNDGEPMTREILVGKLLSLGSSGKDFQNSVGGFGKAKEILYFAHRSYTIASGECRVSGSGAGYNLEEGSFLHGTRSAVVWAGLVGDRLRAQFRRFIELCDRRDCEFTLDGEPVKPKIPRFHCERPLVHEGNVWAHLGVFRFEENLLLVRIGGIPMFVERSDYKRTLVLELQGKSGERLTANRDSLRYPHSTHLRDLITQMAVDRRSALKREEPVYTRFSGPKLHSPEEPMDNAKRPIDDLVAECVTAARATAPEAGGGIAVATRGRAEGSTSLLGYEFILKNCVRRRVPREFDPEGLGFSDHAHWLARAWSGCLLELHDLQAVDHRFSVGFVFSEQVEAEFEKSPEYGPVYYLNPSVIGKTSIRRRWKRADRGQIVAIAAHEFVHGGMGLSYHGEDFANRLTDVMGAVLKHWRRFARHLR